MMNLEKLTKEQETIFKGIKQDIENYRDAMIEILTEYQKKNLEAIEKFKNNINKNI